MHPSRMHTICSSCCLLGGGTVYLSACWDTHPLGLGLDTPLPDTPLGLCLDPQRKKLLCLGLDIPLDLGLDTPL